MRKLIVVLALVFFAAVGLAAQDSTVINLDDLSSSGASVLSVPDSIDALVLRSYADTSIKSMCLSVADFRPDSVVIQEAIPKKDVTDCPLNNGFMGFIRDTSVTPRNIDYLNAIALFQHPHLIVVCGGQRQGPGWTTVPMCRASKLWKRS